MAGLDQPRRTIRLDELIFKATDELLIGPDYTAIMQICDVLNNRRERVPLAVGVFKDRLKHKEKDVVLRTLELIDAVTKNVPESPQYVGSKDFLSVIKKLITNKKTDFIVRETALTYIQSSAIAFKNKSGTHFGEVYESLRKEGVSFPNLENQETRLYEPSRQSATAAERQRSQQKQASSFLQTLAGGIPEPRSPPKSSQSGKKQGSSGTPAGEDKLTLAFSSGGVKGLERELSLLQNNIDLAEEILRNTQSAAELSDNDVFSQIFSTCQAAQSQVQSLLLVPCPPMTEEMVAALIYANDRLLTVQSLHKSVLSGERSQRPSAQPQAIYDEQGSSSSDDDDDDDESNDDFDSLRKVIASQQRHQQPVPQLRGPPKARASQQPTLFPAGSGSTSIISNSTKVTPASGGADDLMDEFAALALRHTTPVGLHPTPVSATPAALPPLQQQQQQQPQLPHPFATAYTPAPMAYQPGTNPFFNPLLGISSPVPYTSPSATSATTGTVPPYLISPAATVQATYPPASTYSYPTYPAGVLPAVSPPTQFQPPPSATPFVPPPVSTPATPGQQQQQTSSTTGNLQDDFDLLFGRH